MTLRARITLLVGLAVALAVAGISGAAFLTARQEVRGEVDQFLLERAALLGPLRADAFGRGFFEGRRPTPGRGQPEFVRSDLEGQLLGRDGSLIEVLDENLMFPVDDRDRRIAAGDGPLRLRDVEVDGRRFRLATIPVRGGAVQLARDLDEADAVLAGLGLRLLLIGGAGVLAAAFVGWLVAGRALVPVRRLTATAEHVAETQDLTSPIELDRTDELGRLASSFNAMLAALDTSRRQQHRLVLDAGHELRTPLTSLRTNIEVLAKQSEMVPAERRRLLDDVTYELEELGDLVTELVELATDSREMEGELEPVRLDEIVRAAVARARRRVHRPIELVAEPAVVAGRPAMLERAVANLIDNADKWSPPGAPIEVAAAGGRVVVRDQGPGIEPEDRPHVFDRFYRATSARTMPGSGLGLAIVRQVAETHGGRVWADAAPEGGAEVGFEIPVSSSA